MTKSYPEKIKKSINHEVAKKAKSNDKNAKWLNSEIDLTDYENIDRLRVAYFNIEQAVSQIHQ